MFSRAVNAHAATQPPLIGNPSVINSQQSNKRKFNRTISSTSTGSLSDLHKHVYFDENDFEDDDKLDLTISPQHKTTDIKYPTLPPLSSQKAPTSSATIPWSSSPPSHFEKPVSTISVESPEQRPTKRRTLPWTSNETDVTESVPAPEAKEIVGKYAWTKPASVVKNEQKEFRKRNALKLAGGKIDTNKDTKIASTHLSDEQKSVARAVVEDGNSVFFTGSAGTGKSVLMRAIISQLRMKYKRELDRLAITASTGLAACVIEGTTLHSWAGIGLGKEPAPELVKKIKRNAKAKTKWLRTKVLIIDEISMVDGELFDKLEQVARSLRNNGRPFGGIQLVITGDFFQLPPVPERNSIAKFAFDAATWNTCIRHTILLTHVFRQKDPVFAGMLNEMRLGKLSSESVRAFQKLSRPLEFHDDVDATELFPTRYEVENANNTRMQRLSGQTITFKSVDSGLPDLVARNKILSNFMAPEVLTLKKGAQVMLIKNIDAQLVNGTLGKVTSFMDEATYATYKSDEETYHTAYREGMSDEEDTKEARERFKIARFKNKEVGTSIHHWPMVRFPLPDGTFRDFLCQPEEWKTETQQGEISAKRVQVPLILAWALSIHKAQGQTLSRVKVDLGKVFEKGQAYVALSRATSQAGLQVQRFDPNKVMVHPKVTHFYEKLVNVKDIQEKKGVGNEASDYERNFVDADDEELYMYG